MSPDASNFKAQALDYSLGRQGRWRERGEESTEMRVRKERTERERPRARYIERLTERKIKNIEAKEKAHSLFPHGC